MQHWRLLEQVFTAQSIMTPRDSFLVWDGAEDLESIWKQADSDKIDTIPVVEQGQIQRFFQRGSPGSQPLTDDWTISADTPIPVMIQIFAEHEKKCLFIFSDEQVLGLVTPADLNRLPARTYFYSLIAELEITLAAYIEQRKLADAELFVMMGNNHKRQKQIQKKLDKSELELGVVHTLYLSEMVKIIKVDEILQESLELNSPDHVDNTLDDLAHFRNDIMHPYNLILSNDVGIEKLHEHTQRTIELLERWVGES